jgi:hypothetical protein
MEALADFWRAAFLFGVGLLALIGIFCAIALMKIGGED